MKYILENNSRWSRAHAGTRQTTGDSHTEINPPYVMVTVQAISMNTRES